MNLIPKSFLHIIKLYTIPKHNETKYNNNPLHKHKNKKRSPYINANYLRPRHAPGLNKDYTYYKRFSISNLIYLASKSYKKNPQPYKIESPFTYF